MCLGKHSQASAIPLRMRLRLGEATGRRRRPPAGTRHHASAGVRNDRINSYQVGTQFAVTQVTRNFAIAGRDAAALMKLNRMNSGGLAGFAQPGSFQTMIDHAFVAVTNAICCDASHT
jgi:hypothetical protein